MKKVRSGIIGMGNQGSHYASLFLDGEIENGVLAAVCDSNPAKLERAKTFCGEIAYFDNFEEMLESGKIDAVLVETPHYDHPKLVTESLRRGIHTVCDKPAGVYTKQVREMNEAASTYSARFAMMFNQRTNCVYRKMKEMIALGELGSLQRMTWIITDWFRTQNYYDNGSWRATWNGEGGGVLINQCPHQIDLVQWVLGEMPTSVRGFCHYGKWHDIEVEDDVTAYFEYANGATGVFVTTTGEAPGTNRFEVSGTKGKLVCENDKLLWYKNDCDSAKLSLSATSGFERPACEIIEVETDGNNPQHKGILNNFTNAILGLEEQFVQGTDGINGVELMNAIELSGWKGGEKVTLPVNEEEYLNELTARRKTSRMKTCTVETVAKMDGTFGGGKK